MSAIPSWLYTLIKLAIQIGSPYLLSLIKKWLGNLPEDVVKIINDLIDGIKNPDVPTKEAKTLAKAKLKQARFGVGSAPDTKGIE